jgi:hypothetical protein
MWVFLFLLLGLATGATNVQLDPQPYPPANWGPTSVPARPFLNVKRNVEEARFLLDYASNAHESQTIRPSIADIEHFRISELLGNGKFISGM